MMERDFIAQKTKEFLIKRYLESKLSNVGLSQIKLKKIPLGEKIIIYTSRPSLIVGSKGANIKDLTNYLKKEFKLENPQIEINEIKNVFLDANVVAERIVSFLERFGSARFKSIGHKMMENVMNAGALGIEIIVSGKIPGARAKSWRFYQGYLKKCGDVSFSGIKRAKKVAALKSGIIGVKVSIMPPDIKLPDKIKILETPLETAEAKPQTPEKLPEETTKKKAPKKKKSGEEKISEGKKDEKGPENKKEKTKTPKVKEEKTLEEEPKETPKKTKENEEIIEEKTEGVTEGGIEERTEEKIREEIEEREAL